MNCNFKTENKTNLRQDIIGNMDDNNAVEDRIKEVNKTLRNIKCCNPLNWNGPSAHEVDDRLYVGNGHAARSVPYLTSLGITHLLNAAHPGDNVELVPLAPGVNNLISGPNCSMSITPDTEALKAANIEYIGLQLADENTQEISSTFSKSGEWIQNALTDPTSKVLVNCWAGCSRSATIAMAFMMRHRGMRLVQAVRLSKSSRDIQPNGGFVRQLVVYEQKIYKE
eukprot:TRINITY_DN6252_c0_g1_i2.p1 TRINITY_DN6252_c0_g1~~TRINITY_DN6252_c0_g1_i2.p1  ORF type:complete len:225 (+),score=56.90 TRINITY_DN6252_c0_g1_i2:3-677(+)